MADTDLDAATLANYRREIERATASDERARGATAAVFAALDRRDARDREMRLIVRELADLGVFANIPDLQSRARALLGGGK